MPEHRLARPRLLVLVSLACVLACSSSSAPGDAGDGDGATKTEPASEGPLTPELRAKVCGAEHVDATSKIFIARNEAGVAARIVVTPSRRIADMGNLVFDMDGELLGHETGSEFPWDDQALADEERARIAKIMGGAVIPNGEAPLSCAE